MVWDISSRCCCLMLRRLVGGWGMISSTISLHGLRVCLMCYYLLQGCGTTSTWASSPARDFFWSFLSPKDGQRESRKERKVGYCRRVAHTTQLYPLLWMGDDEHKCTHGMTFSASSSLLLSSCFRYQFEVSFPFLPLPSLSPSEKHLLCHLQKKFSH